MITSELWRTKYQGGHLPPQYPTTGIQTYSNLICKRYLYQTIIVGKMATRTLTRYNIGNLYRSRIIFEK